MGNADEIRKLRRAEEDRRKKDEERNEEMAAMKQMVSMLEKEAKSRAASEEKRRAASEEKKKIRAEEEDRLKTKLAALAERKRELRKAIVARDLESARSNDDFEKKMALLMSERRPYALLPEQTALESALPQLSLEPAPPTPERVPSPPPVKKRTAAQIARDAAVGASGVQYVHVEGRTQWSLQRSNIIFTVLSTRVRCLSRETTVDSRPWTESLRVQLEEFRVMPPRQVMSANLGEFAGCFLYAKFTDGREYKHAPGTVAPARYGGTDDHNLFLCYTTFCTKEECPFGRTCRYRHAPLLSGEVAAILSGHRPQFIEVVLDCYARPSLPEVNGFPIPPPPPTDEKEQAELRLLNAHPIQPRPTARGAFGARRGGQIGRGGQAAGRGAGGASGASRGGRGGGQAGRGNPLPRRRGSLPDDSRWRNSFLGIAEDDKAIVALKRKANEEFDTKLSSSKRHTKTRRRT